MGNAIGDAFFPDNPERRRRAEELYTDLQSLKHEFDDLHSRYRQEVLGLERPVQRLLNALGYRNADELHTDAEKSLSGPVLEAWRELQSRIDKNDKVDSVIAGIASITAVSGAVTVGVLVMLGAITVATGGAALAAIAAVAAVVAVAALVAGIVEGAIQRDKLRDAIRDLYWKRREAKLAVEQMHAVMRWMSLFTLGVEGLDMRMSTSELMSKLTDLMPALDKAKETYDAVSWHSVDRALRVIDDNRGSWRNEDP